MGNIETIHEYRSWCRQNDGIFREENCPLCDLELQKNYTLYSGNYWKVIQNRFPYSGNEKHLMVIPIQHKIYSHQITPEEYQELTEIHNWMKGFYGDEDYFSFCRESMAARTIEHLHIHFLPGKIYASTLRNMLKDQGFPTVL